MANKYEGKRLCGRPSVTFEEVRDLFKRHPGRFVKLRDKTREWFLAEPLGEMKSGQFVKFRVLGVIVHADTVAPILWPGEVAPQQWEDEPMAGVAIIRRAPDQTATGRTPTPPELQNIPLPKKRAD